MNSSYALQPLAKSEIPRLLETLKSLLPDSIIAYNWLLNGSKWVDGPGLETKILILCPNGDTTDGSMFGLIDGLTYNNKTFGTFYAQNENLDRMTAAISETEHIEWKRLMYLRIWSRFAPHLTEVIKAKGLQFAEMYATVNAAITTAGFPSLTIPNDVRIGLLDESHLEVVCDSWSHYNLEYRLVIKKMLQCNPSVGIFVKTGPSGQEALVSMAVQADNGGIGLLQTIPEYRRKGYGTIVTVTLAKTIAANHLVPVGYIVKGNDPSSTLFNKCGFEEIGDLCKITFISD